MYYEHFGLAQPPFRITPDTAFFYDGGNRGPILEALIYAIRHGEGIIKVTGEVGTGKTTLCSMLQTLLPASVETIYIVNPGVSPAEVLRAIALELQLDAQHSSSHLKLMQLVHHHLLKCHAEHRQVVMFVEESQNMPLATLEEIRLLSNLETTRGKLLQIVLFGQPEFDDALRQPNIRQLRDRICYSFHLSPLKQTEIRDYLNFRMRAAGYHGPELFTKWNSAAIARGSRGLTRRINLIADKALLAAYSENTHAIKFKHVKAAIHDCEFGNLQPAKPMLQFALALGLLVIGTGIGAALYPIVRTYLNRAIMPLASEYRKLLPGTGSGASAQNTAQMLWANDRANSQLMYTPRVLAASVTATASSVDTTPPVRSVDADARSAAGAEQPGTTEQLERQLAATQAWLEQRAQTDYSIQLMGVDNVAQLQRQLGFIGSG